MTSIRPLVVDVDGTFLKTDMLYEGFWLALGKDPARALQTSFRLFGKRAKLKEEMTRLADIQVELLPVNKDVLDLMHKARSEGREVIFASGADRLLIEHLAQLYSFEGDHIASDGIINMTGHRKAVELVQRYGEAGFDYVGDAQIDLEVWRHAGAAIIVGKLPAAQKELESLGLEVTTLGKTNRRRSLIRSLRPHQWVKNILLLLPMVAAHLWDADGFVAVLLAMVAFSAAASSIYIVNDLLDLEADRQHPTKKNRPIAAGAVRIPRAMITSLVLGVVALGLGGILGARVLGIVSLYMLLSLSYSLSLKKMRWIDIVALACLYSLRVIAGAFAAGIVASGWLVTFIFPAFFALGCVKRLTELTLARSDGKVPGRGYVKADRSGLLNVASLCASGSVLVFLVYSFSPTGEMLYDNPLMLRIALVPVSLWMVRMIWLGWHGKQDYDPLVFAMRDKIGLGLIAATIAVLFYAAGVFG